MVLVSAQKGDIWGQTLRKKCTALWIATDYLRSWKNIYRLLLWPLVYYLSPFLAHCRAEINVHGLPTESRLEELSAFVTQAPSLWRSNTTRHHKRHTTWKHSQNSAKVKFLNERSNSLILCLSMFYMKLPEYTITTLYRYIVMHSLVLREFKKGEVKSS